MNLRVIVHLIALLMLFLSIGMGISAVVAGSGPDPVWVRNHLAICALAILLLGSLLFCIARCYHRKVEFSTGVREGFATVALSWLVGTALGAVPFCWIARMTIPDALFEAASGLTTTGASVISTELILRDGTVLADGIEGLPQGLLFWRSLLNWFGGVGIVFFVLLILPLLHVGKGSLLYNAEVPGLKTDSDQLTPRLFQSVLWVLGLYAVLTVAAAIGYRICGMNLFDAACHAMSTISTGGFSTRNASFAAFPGAALQWTVIVFMLLSACNFTLFLRSILQRRFCFWEDEEFRFFLGMVVVATVVVALLLYEGHPDGLNGVPCTVESYLRLAAFQVASLASTTGFTTADFDAWGVPVITAILLLIMFPCGCGGSTAGGMKCSRILVLGKAMLAEVRQCLFPHTLTDIRLNGARLAPTLVRKTFVFALLYLTLIALVAFALLGLTGASLGTCGSAALTCLSNVGPGIGAVGPSCSFGWMGPMAKILLALTMITGRLELYTMLVLFLPAFWRR